MKLIRYNPSLLMDPVDGLADFRDELDRFFGHTIPAFRGVTSPIWSTPCPINLYREDDGYVLRAEIPGFDKKDLTLEVVDGSLLLSGHSHREDKSKKLEESSEARFTRTVPLPDEVDASAIKAEYTNGVLTVTLPKRPETKPRQIAIDVK